MRICTKCKKEKEETLFYPRYSGTGLSSQCKRCHSRAKEYTCERCGTVWESIRGGKGRRNFNLCDKCYPAYRQAEKLYHSALNRSKRSKLDFDLEVLDIEKKLRGCCPKTGEEFRILYKSSDYSNRHPYSPSIDKIDPSKGYTKDNTQIVCWLYNLAKAQFSDKDLLDFCRNIVNTNDIKLSKT